MQDARSRPNGSPVTADVVCRLEQSPGRARDSAGPTPTAYGADRRHTRPLQRIQNPKSKIQNRALPAFTLVELLVSISIIVLLLTLLFAGTQAIYESFRRTTTQQTFRTIGAAIDQFEQLNPLRGFYDQPSRLGAVGRTFGPLPPYQVRDNVGVSANSITAIFEATDTDVNTLEAPVSLAQRLSRDLSGAGAPPPEGWRGWVDTVDNTAISYASPNVLYAADNDNRALYAYLRAFNPAGLRQVTPSAIKPLPISVSELGRPITHEAIRLPGSSSFGASAQSYSGSTPDDKANWAELQGFHDAWGVPLDYMLYVKVEPGVRVDPPPMGNLQPYIGWRVTDRQWALRSHGISRDRYESRVRALVQAGQNGPWEESANGADPDGIYSSPLPTPYAGPKPPPVVPSPINEPPGLTLNPAATNPQEAGWVRLRGAGEWKSYNYLPGVPFQ